MPKNIGTIINKGVKHEQSLKTVERIFIREAGGL